MRNEHCIEILETLALHFSLGLPEKAGQAGRWQHAKVSVNTHRIIKSNLSAKRLREQDLGTALLLSNLREAE